MVYVILEAETTTFIYVSYRKEDVAVYNVTNIKDIDLNLFQVLKKFAKNNLILNRYHTLNKIISFRILEDEELRILRQIYTFENDIYTSQKSLDILELLEYNNLEHRCKKLLDMLKYSGIYNYYITRIEDLKDPPEKMKEYYKFLKYNYNLALLRSNKFSKITKVLYKLIWEYLTDVSYIDIINPRKEVWDKFNKDTSMTEDCVFRFYLKKNLVIDYFITKSKNHIYEIKLEDLLEFENFEEMKSLIEDMKFYNLNIIYLEII